MQNGKKYPCINIKNIGKNIKWEEGRAGALKLGEENQNLKKWGLEEYQVIGNSIIHPCNIYFLTYHINFRFQIYKISNVRFRFHLIFLYIYFFF